MQFVQRASARQRRELTAFARYCILRVERELGRHHGWVVKIEPTPGNYVTRIAVHDAAGIVEATGVGLDGALATWEAICRIEESLRELAGTRAKPVRLATCAH